MVCQTHTYGILTPLLSYIVSQVKLLWNIVGVQYTIQGGSFFNKMVQYTIQGGSFFNKMVQYTMDKNAYLLLLCYINMQH
jgi:uncharacterized membrane protein